MLSVKTNNKNSCSEFSFYFSEIHRDHDLILFSRTINQNTKLHSYRHPSWYTVSEFFSPATCTSFPVSINGNYMYASEDTGSFNMVLDINILGREKVICLWNWESFNAFHKAQILQILFSHFTSLLFFYLFYFNLGTRLSA